MICQLAGQLAAHHTQPRYKELMGKGKQAWGWQNTSWENANAKKSKDKGKGKGATTDANFPGYDAAGSSGASGSQSVLASTAEDGTLKKALSEIFQKNNMEIPSELQPYFQPKIGEMLQSDQKRLNTKRKFVAKLDRLKKAVTKKQEQWQAFRAAMREHLAKEQSRFDTDMEELKAAIQETQASLDKMLQGGEEDHDMEDEPKETTLEEILQENDVTKQNKTEPKTEITVTNDAAWEELKQARMGQLQLSQQVQELQQQLLYVTSAIKTPMQGSPSSLHADQAQAECRTSRQWSLREEGTARSRCAQGTTDEANRHRRDIRLNGYPDDDFPVTLSTPSATTCGHWTSHDKPIRRLRVSFSAHHYGLDSFTFSPAPPMTAFHPGSLLNPRGHPIAHSLHPPGEHRHADMVETQLDDMEIALQLIQKSTILLVAGTSSVHASWTDEFLQSVGVLAPTAGTVDNYDARWTWVSLATRLPRPEEHPDTRIFRVRLGTVRTVPDALVNFPIGVDAWEALDHLVQLWPDLTYIREVTSLGR